MSLPQVKKIMTARDAGLALGWNRQMVNKKIQGGFFKSAMKLDTRQHVVRRGEVEAILAGTHEAYVVPEDDL